MVLVFLSFDIKLELANWWPSLIKVTLKYKAHWSFSEHGNSLFKGQKWFHAAFNKIGKQQLMLIKFWSGLWSKEKNLFLKRNHKTDKCQFLNLGSHFSERSFGVVLCLVLTDILVNSIVLLQGFPLSSWVTGLCLTAPNYNCKMSCS